MSLLLLFPTSISTSWSTTTLVSSTWTSLNSDFKDRWGDWISSTWGAVASSGITWGQMAGYTFVNTTGNSTVWVVSS